MHLKLKNSVVALGLASVIVPYAAFAAAPRANAHQAQPTSPAHAQPAVDPALAAGEIFESLTEGAPSVTAPEFNRALARFQLLHLSLSQTLSPAARARLDALVSGVRSAWRDRDRATMAVQSIEAYRLLQESATYAGQPVPIEVSLLDYAGFKLVSLMLSSHPDWQASVVTAQEATGWWRAICPSVGDPNLRQSMERTIQAIHESTSRQDRAQVGVAAKQDLALVDELEAYFTSHPVRG